MCLCVMLNCININAEDCAHSPDPRGGRVGRRANQDAILTPCDRWDVFLPTTPPTPLPAPPHPAPVFMRASHQIVGLDQLGRSKATRSQGGTPPPPHANSDHCTWLLVEGMNPSALISLDSFPHLASWRRGGGWWDVKEVREKTWQRKDGDLLRPHFVMLPSSPHACAFFS